MAKKMQYQLYRKFYTKAKYDIEGVFEFVPKIYNLCMPSERIDAKSLFIRFVFCVMTFGKFKIFGVKSALGEVVHTSYVIPKCVKFPFLKKGEFEVGPCYTAPEFRRQGAYVKALTYITTHKQFENACFYMIVNEVNSASVKGIENAGFQKTGTVSKTRFLKRYYINEV